MPVPVRNSVAAAKKLVMLSETKMLDEVRQFALDGSGRKAPGRREQHSLMQM